MIARAATPIAIFAALASCKGSSVQAPDAGANACGGTGAPWTTLALVAGSPGGKGLVDGSLTAAHFSDPRTLVGDGAGHLYVADDETVRVVDLSAKTVTTITGGVAPGFADGPAATATFNTPSGLALDGNQLYIADSENSTIRLMDLGARAVTTVAGSLDQGAVDASGTAARFQEPEGLALAPAGNLYIADTDNNTIRVMALGSGDAVTTVAGLASAPAGSDDGVGSAARFSKTTAIALSPSGDLFVVDDHNMSVRRVATSTQDVTTLTTFASAPVGICVDGTDVLVSLGDHTIVRADPSGTLTMVVGMSNSTGLVDGAGAAARLKFPGGLYNNGNGTVYVADEGNFVIRALSLADGSMQTIAGVVSIGSSDGAGAAAHFSAPQGMVVDGSSVYVADTGNATIRLLASDTGVVTTIAGAAGQTGSADGAADAARFAQPEGLALDSAAHVLYVADSGNHVIRRIDLATGVVGTLAPVAAPGDPFAGFVGPAGVAFDRGLLYVTDSSADTVSVVDLSNGQTSIVAGTAYASTALDGVGAQATFSQPSGVAADGRGTLFIADTFNHTLRRIDLATRAVTTLAGEPNVQGASDGVGRAAHFGFLSSIALSGCDLYVSDSNNNEIRHVDTNTGAVTTVLGSATKSGVLLGPLPTQITLPSALAAGPGGGLLVVSENAVLWAR